jgi:hypothetical protein
MDQVEEASKTDPDLFVFAKLSGVGSVEVNVFQRGCDVLFKSLSAKGSA